MLSVILAGCGGAADSVTGLFSQSKHLARDDKTAITDASYQDVVEQLYVAYYGRPADPAGLAYWESVLHAANAPTSIAGLNTVYSTPAIKAIVDSFGNSSESQALYGTGNSSGFINAIYQNILARSTSTDQAGANYWAGLLSNGSMTQAQAALAILAAAAGEPTTSADEQVVANRLAMADVFTGQVSSQNAGGSYSGANANSNARAMLAQVNSNTDATTFAAAAASTLAAIVNQAVFESTALNGGEGAIYGNLPYGGGTMVSGTNFIYAETINALKQSPSTGAQFAMEADASLDSALTVPGEGSSRVLHNGQITLLPGLAQRRVTYVGSDVQVDRLATDGTTVLYSSHFFNYSSLPLSGPMENSPEEMQATVPISQWIVYNNFAANAQWQSGAAYIKKQGMRNGDYYEVSDCTNVASPTYTTGNQPTPCLTGGSLASFFPFSLVDQDNHPNETYFAGDGTISTIQGLTMWVANSPMGPGLSSTQDYRFFVELNGNVYMGYFEKDGTQYYYPNADGTSVNYVITLNQAAVASVQKGIISGASLPGSQAGLATAVSSMSDLFGIGGTGTNGSLSPADLRKHYNVPSSLTGAGQTIAIVDAPGSGNVADDLNTYSQYYGLPQCNSANPCFQHIDLSNGAAIDGTKDWGSEIELDTQMVHAMAPGATIILVTAASSNGSDLQAAVNYAANLPGVTAVSMSFTVSSGFSYAQEAVFAGYQARGWPVFFASSGDSGHQTYAPYPAESQYVTSVGGTRINSVTWNSPSSETAWQYSGGGRSFWVLAPDWQLTTIPVPYLLSNTSSRAVPDVAAVADFKYSAVSVYYKDNWVLMGGTSASAPIWAGISALLGQYLANQNISLSNLVSKTKGGFNGLLYGTVQSPGTGSGFYDITSGTNNLTTSLCALCTAQTGYDDVTGLGTPNVASLFANIAGESLNCKAGVGGGTNGLSFYTTAGSFAYTISNSTASASETSTLNWGVNYNNSSSSSGAYTGSLRARLWAVSTPYSGGTITGYVEGLYTPNFSGQGSQSSNQLDNGYYVANIQSTASGTNAPAGIYCLVATLEEYQASGVYTIVDWATYSSPVIFQ
ncbi:MAG: DUF4214 domain-containing protein [Burkholderiaceae bacterium]|nr:DUF4214 domain-containing protein [Burkholderiaceae bacterium]